MMWQIIGKENQNAAAPVGAGENLLGLAGDSGFSGGSHCGGDVRPDPAAAYGIVAPLRATGSGLFVYSFVPLRGVLIQELIQIRRWAGMMKKGGVFSGGSGCLTDM